MKRLPIIVALAGLLTCLIASCGDDDNNWADYTEWREANDAWYEEQKALTNPDGSLYYTPVVPSWYQGSGVLMHYFNDRALTQGNLRPLANSSVKVKYKGELYNGAGFDSSYTEVDSCRTFTLGPDLIMGWRIALADMHVGDSAAVVIPWAQAYGMTGNSGIQPFSDLLFQIKLVDIVTYEVRP